MTEKLNDLLPTTPDVQAERLAELKRLFPDLFDGEGQLKLDEVKQLTGDEPQCRERYDFSWYGKRKAKETAYTPTTATLTYDESRSVNPDKADGNLIIEGENLETLKALLSAYRESIKCIYIDPPYNTGKDFVYSDNYSEDKRAYWEETGGLENGVKVDTNPETAGRYHSNWLSMMYSRLILARQLLKDDGVIFVSIDDNEVHNLRRLMDDVFGEDNFVGQVTWKARVKPVNIGEAKYRPQKEVEYILVYKKNLIDGTFLPLFTGSVRSYPHVECNRKYRLTTILKSNRGVNHRSTMTFNLGSYTPPEGQRWQAGEDVINQLNDDGYIEFRDETPFKKYYEDEEGAEHDPFYCFLESLWSSTSEAGKSQLNKILSDQHGFDTVKPVTLIKTIIQASMGSDDLLIDFFGGSGTSAQALVELNNKDGGKRKFILVQLPEQISEKSEARKAGYNKISDITIERVKRVIQGYGENPQPLDTGFKVYQLTKSQFPRTEFKPDPEKTEAENIKVLKDYIKEKEKQLTGLFEATEIQDEVLLKNGFKLNYQLSDASEFTRNKIKYADDGEKQSLLCLDSKLDPETVDQLIKSPQAFICLERALSTDDKWNLREHLKHEFIAF